VCHRKQLSLCHLWMIKKALYPAAQTCTRATTIPHS
jgi:hypothetical protein